MFVESGIHQRKIIGWLWKASHHERWEFSKEMPTASKAIAVSMLEQARAA